MFKHVSIIGAGTMGRGIAYTCAVAGFSVAVQDIHSHTLEACKDYIEKQFQKAVEKGLLAAEQASLFTENIVYTTSLEEAAEQADLVIEAVLEIMEFKV
jgi:3-hydroxybutyryl-CoA dehydrogenase